MTKEKDPANSANGEFEFQEPAGRNIVIFSDGTGQDGGVHPEQRLSNVYKLYRAARVGPDNDIDPDAQVAFYDPGLGTDTSDGPDEHPPQDHQAAFVGYWPRNHDQH